MELLLKAYILEAVDVEKAGLVGGELNPAFEAEFPGKFANMKMWFAINRRTG